MKPVVVHVHVYDMSHGRAAVDVRLRLETLTGTRWQPVATTRTGETGQCGLGSGTQRGRGTYRVVCETDPYYVGLGATPCYPEVVITFRVIDDPYQGHVMILITTAGYTVFVGQWSIKD